MARNNPLRRTAPGIRDDTSRYEDGPNGNSCQNWIASMAVCLYSSRMIVYLHRLRDHGWPIPKYQFAFKEPVEGELTLHEERDSILNRHARIARLRSLVATVKLDVPPLLDAQLVELTRERLVLSGIERFEDITISKTQDFAQTWVCWFSPHA